LSIDNPARFFPLLHARQQNARNQSGWVAGPPTLPSTLDGETHAHLLAAEYWNDIRAAYAAGADARALARQWSVSVSCIYRRAVSEGGAKRTRTVTEDPERDAYAPAHRQNAPKIADAPWRQGPHVRRAEGRSA
jgi:hypothetical protein